jgi:hypothetical protein
VTTVAAAAAGPSVPVAPPAAPAPALPVVTIAAVSDGSFSESDDRPCSNVSAETMERGQVEVRRSGATDDELVVGYAPEGMDADHDPMAGWISIPAGASSAVIYIDPHPAEAPAPRHEHRSGVVRVTLQGRDTYTLGPVTSVSVTLRFDIDVFGCSRPARRGDPAGAEGVS